MKFRKLLALYEQPEGRCVGHLPVLMKAVVSERPSAVAASSHWPAVVIWEAPLAAQLSPLE